MGCSPSKGNFTGAQGAFRGKTLLPGNKGNLVDSQFEDGVSGSSCGGEIEGEAGKKTIAGEKVANTYGNAVSSIKKPVARAASEKLDTQEITIDLSQYTKDEHLEKQVKKEVIKGRKARKTTKNAKTNRKIDKGQNPVVEKVDFPEALVKAHKAAYRYLNPSIAKYDLLLGLLDHAAQTHLCLQPMVAFMALRFEEINRGLEEMVAEGEQLLKDSGAHLAWPCDMKNRSSSTGSVPSEPPPDLLQQLLQYTVQRMSVVGQSLSGIGDTALKEAVEYFSSVSEVLEEKLNAKRAAEARLMQLLSRIEAASLRRPGPEDSTLFSEDSGIGAESESLAGSDRQRHRRESCGSNESNRTILCSPGSMTPIRKPHKQQQQQQQQQQHIRKMSHSNSVTSIDSTCTVAGKEFKDTESLLGSASLDDSDSDVEESEEECCETTVRTDSSSCPPEPGHQPRRLPAQRIENPQNVEMTLKLKDAISGRIHFVPSQHSAVKTKSGIPKVSDRQWTEEGEKSSKRPQSATHRAPKRKTTATKHCRSRSADSLRSKAEDVTMVELERTQKELSQRLEEMGKVQTEQKKDLPKQTHAQQKQASTPTAAGQLSPLNKKLTPVNNKKNVVSVKGKLEIRKEKEEEKKKKDNAAKVPMKAPSVPSPPPSPGMCRKGNSVKKLIVTFSQGLEESKQIHGSTKVLGPLKGVRKCGIPIIPGLGNEAALPCNKTDQIADCGESRTSDRTDDFDLDDLPPPPLEVLMDNSFENVEASKPDESLNSRGCSTLPKMTSISQRLRASVQSVTVLPSKGSMRKPSQSISPAQNVALDLSGMKTSHLASKPEVVSKNEEAASLYQQARKIIHLRHSSGSPTEKGPAEIDDCTQTHLESNQEDNEAAVVVPSPAADDGQALATPPASKVRTLPSTPILNRRLPSPPVLNKPPNSSSSSPVTLRKLPTPPQASQRTLPNTPVTQREVTSRSSTGVTYPFKAPSPPASPKVQRRSRNNSIEESISRGFSNARSVFCPASPSLFEAKPCPVPKPPQAWTSSGSSILPRPWGEHSRLSMSTSGPQPFVRRSQSDRRPSLRVPPRAPIVSIAQTCGSEPAISTQGLDETPTREAETWNEQLDLRGANRSASHPDLCIVGQALQCE